MEEEKVLLEAVTKSKFDINYFNPYLGTMERHNFPPYKFNSNRPRTAEVTKDCFYWLKDETTTFKDGYLRLVERDDKDKDKTEEILVASPEYENNAMTREEIKDILKGNVSIAKMKEKLSKITSYTEKMLVIDVAKEMKITSVNKLRAIVDVFYDEDTDIEVIFPIEELAQE